MQYQSCKVRDCKLDSLALFLEQQLSEKSKIITLISAYKQIPVQAW